MTPSFCFGLRNCHSIQSVRAPQILSFQSTGVAKSYAYDMRHPVKRNRYLRPLVLVVVLAGIAGWQIVREYRPPVLKAGVRLYAYIANAGDGSVSVVDLVALKTIATIPVGPIPSGLHALPLRKEIWGV